MQKPKPDPDLAYGLKFSGDDLEANQDGVMSAAQQAYLKGYCIFQILACLIFLVLALVFGGIFVGMFSYYPKSSINCLFFFIFGIFFVGGTIFIFLRYLNRVLKVTDDVRMREVEAVNGNVVLDPRRFTFVVGTTKFLVTRREGFLRFKHLEPYIVYYAPNSKIVLSAEPMEK